MFPTSRVEVAKDKQGNDVRSRELAKAVVPTNLQSLLLLLTEEAVHSSNVNKNTKDAKDLLPISGLLDCLIALTYKEIKGSLILLSFQNSFTTWFLMLLGRRETCRARPRAG